MDDSRDFLEDHKKTIHKLFDVACELCLMEGGDGDVWIISESYKRLANMFEEYKPVENWFSERNNRVDSVGFSHAREGISFIKDRTQLPKWAITVIESSLL